MTFMPNQTLRDFLDIYAHEVTELRSSLDHAQNREQYQTSEVERMQKKLDENEKFTAGIVADSRAEAKRATKLEGIIESLKIELQQSRSEHTATGAELDSANALLDRIYDALTDDGTEKAKVLMIHEMITADRRDRRGHDDA